MRDYSSPQGPAAHSTHYTSYYLPPSLEKLSFCVLLCQETLPGVPNLQPTGHMQARMAMNVAQHKTVNLPQTLFCSSVFTSVCVFNVWPKTTLLPVWYRDAKRLDTPESLGFFCVINVYFYEQGSEHAHLKRGRETEFKNGLTTPGVSQNSQGRDQKFRTP